jgi:Domain of unknown function (DUF4177)
MRLALAFSALAAAFAAQADETAKPPPPKADKVVTSAAVQKWDYADEFMCRTAATSNYPQQIQARLNQYGAVGWELVSFDDFKGPLDAQYSHCYFAVFKRPATS